MTTITQDPVQAGFSGPTASSSMFGALRHRNFRLYWSAMMLSVIAQNMEFVAVAWLVLVITDSPLAIGLAALASSAPVIGLNLVGGAIADRVDRRGLLLIVQALAATLYVAIAMLILSGLVQFWHVIVFAFLLGTARAFDGPVRMALVPQMVPKHDIPSAVSLVNIVWQLPRMVGPAIAGLLIAAFGVGPSFLISGLGALGALALFALLRVDRQAATVDHNLLRNIREGLSFVRNSSITLALIAMSFFNSVFGMSFVLMEAVFARDILRVGSEGFGFMETVGAVGSIVGVMAAAFFARAHRKGWQTILGAMTFGLFVIGFAISSSYPLSLVLLFFCGLLSQMYMTTINTTLQMTVPNEMRGRVMGLYGLTYSLLPVGGAVVGAVTEVAGAPVAVSLGGSLVVAMALGVAVIAPRVRNLR